ncbi:hypothetical protein RHODGE_RHODGE_02849 [Rhodoplanes serenus]|uniref:Uncharacterized protein n=1 Tax=Rhodoplanes serenus TaxID=200615 RepID=A0A3S5CYG7_9BRAD|nr:hypothetical protein [Rhodoplanes serenus]MBI5112719.1 hypothetical protein [Rhodovulum sp.]VCU09680.1 hypothetical protein RHODGE_RHODGE_02849 [Rhodoplanes serenus]
MTYYIHYSTASHDWHDEYSSLEEARRAFAGAYEAYKRQLAYISDSDDRHGEVIEDARSIKEWAKAKNVDLYDDGAPGTY